MKAKANYERLGPKMGAMMKHVAKAIENMSEPEIELLKRVGYYIIDIGNDDTCTITPEDVVEIK